MPPEQYGKKRSIIDHVRHWYAKFEQPFSSLSLIGGFVFDALTLTHVEAFWENFWVIAHLTIVTACAIAINIIENKDHDEENPERLHFWLVNIMQFFFGGIFSTYLVFYFRSGSIAVSWPFLALLAIAFIANERLKRHYARLAFQLSLIFLSYYVFAIYLLPILFHQINVWLFLLSGAASLTAIGLIIFILKKFSHEQFRGKKTWLAYGAIGIIFVAINTLYFFNLIPPLPLSLKDADVYQTLIVNNPGNYTVQHEDQGWLSFFAWSETIHLAPGDPLYAYTAVFSPTALNTNILHVWQYFDNTKEAWVTRGRITLSVIGGADGGYRTFSEESGLTQGAWRVNVETPNGQVIGQLRFDVITTSTVPSLQTEQIN